MVTNRLRKAVFPVAGLGSRFLPATKASPKEMLPVVDKPLIQYAVEEAAAAGVTDMIFVTGRNKRAIEDHFDKAYELEAALEAGGKADELFDADPPVMAQLAERFTRSGHAVLGVVDVPPQETRNYGIVATRDPKAAVSQLTGIVEKPAAGEAPTTLAVMGRYVLTPGIFDLLAGVKPGRGGEIQLTDGIAALLAAEPVEAMRFSGSRYDCGSKLGYLKATVELGLRHPEVGAAFGEYLRNRRT